MKLLIVLITHNRLKYTRKTLRHLWASIELPYYLVVVDNASTDGTQAYLEKTSERGRIDAIILNKDNKYPGAAANQGWEFGLIAYPQATHLMRLDNDMELRRGWDLEAQRYFETMPHLGQLGLDYSAVEGHPEAEIKYGDMAVNSWPGVVGGPCIIKRAIFDSGVRYDETPWHNERPGVPQQQEDSKLSHELRRLGYLVGHATGGLTRTFADETNWKDYPDYYKRTFAQRGYDNLIEKIGS